MRLATIAEDLTSATDGTAAFGQRGWAVEVLLRWRLSNAEADVVSIDTDSRATSMGDAVNRVRDAAHLLRSAPVLVKQFDSTLRGHVVAECMAALREGDRSRLIVVAAFPSAGRTTMGGIQQLDGVQLERTSFGRDPVNPVSCSDLVVMFREGSLDVSLARTADEARLQAIDHEVVVVDAADESDIDGVIAAVGEQSTMLWAGSTGLLRGMARGWGEATRPSSTVPPAQPSSLSALIVVGSINPVSRTQVAFVEAAGWSVIRIDSPDGVAAAVDAATHSAATRTPLCLTTAESRTDPSTAMNYLTSAAVAALQTQCFDGLVATGGETARRIANRLGASALVVVREIEPGIPLCLLRVGTRLLPLITKAGGFGSPEFLATVGSRLSVGVQDDL